MSKTIQLSSETLAILKNFATISQSIWFKEGDSIKTRAPSREVYAIANIGEVFPIDFSIYDLPRFLNVIGLFETETELRFEEIDNGVVIGSGKNCVRYIFSDPIIMPNNCVPPSEYDKKPRLPEIVGNFKLKSEILDKVKKAASVLGSPNISIVSIDGEVKLIAHDKKNTLSDQFAMEIDGAQVSKNFVVDLKLETLRLLPGEYEVSVAEKIAVHFQNKTIPVEYFISCQISLT